MALSYSLNFKKLNLSGRVLLEKEGEIVFNRQSFCLKGKGANDRGETIHFTDIKELRYDQNSMVFLTFGKEKFIISRLGTSHEAFLEDFFKIKNEFFVDSLFMKVGMLVGEFDCNAEIISQFGKSINKGRSVIYFYEQSIVVVPRMSDAFVIYLNFLKDHEFDEMDYVLRLEADNGMKVVISKLGSHFEDVQEIVENAMEKMYQRVLNHLHGILPEFPLPTLLKLAYKIRDGRCVSVQDLKKIDVSLPQRVLEIAFEGNLELEKKVQLLRGMDSKEQLHIGFSFDADAVRAWFLCALPTLNTIVIGMSNQPSLSRVFFFRIVMEQGLPEEKVAGKILEVNQCMVLFDYDISVIFKDKNELRKSRYRTALMKLAFLRLFRRSYLGHTDAVDVDKFKSNAEKFFSQAKILHRPVLRHRQLFKSAL